jgi:ribosomal protein L11 methyltransferase
MSNEGLYYTLTVAEITPAEGEIIASIAFDAGAAGTEELLQFVQNNREYEPVTIENDITTLKIYFTTAPEQKFIEDLKSKYSHAQIHLFSDHVIDWMAEWKKSFKPFLLAGSTWVVPSWCETPKEAKTEIRIDPGMAFGTGTHETTRLAAGFLNDFAGGAAALKKNSTLIDVGTGTGILAIQGEKMGFSYVVGNDIDIEARRVARENVEINKCRVTKIIDEDISQVTEKFDWVVANIIDGVLVKLQPSLKLAVKPGGFLLLTGILQERDELFRSEFSFEGYEIIGRRQLGEWVGYLLKRFA